MRANNWINEKKKTWVTNHFFISVADRHRPVKMRLTKRKGQQSVITWFHPNSLDSDVGQNTQIMEKIFRQRKFSWQGRKRNLWTLAREIKLKLHITLISHWKPQTIPGKEETIMLSLMLDVSNLSKHFSILWERTKVPRVFHLPFPQDLEAVVLPVILSFNLGSSFTIVSCYWLVSSRLSPWRWKVDMQVLDNQATAGKQQF